MLKNLSIPFFVRTFDMPKRMLFSWTNLAFGNICVSAGCKCLLATWQSNCHKIIDWRLSGITFKLRWGSFEVEKLFSRSQRKPKRKWMCVIKAKALNHQKLHNAPRRNGAKSGALYSPLPSVQGIKWKTIYAKVSNNKNKLLSTEREKLVPLHKVAFSLCLRMCFCSQQISSETKTIRIGEPPPVLDGEDD